MRAAAVLAEDGVEHGLARAGVEHVKAIAGDHHRVFREVEFDHLADGGVAHVGWDVAGLELAQQHVDEDAIGLDGLLRHVAQLFVGAVHGVAGLEGHDPIPTALGDLGAQLNSGAEGLGKVAGEIREVEHLDRPNDEGVARGLESSDSGMGVVVRAKDLGNNGGALRIRKRFDRGHFLYGEDGIAVHIGI